MTGAGRPTVDELLAGIRSGDRAALARAITLVESRHERDAGDAEELIERVLPDTGSSVRVGVSGVPGVGKSTFIEALGTRLTAAGRRVAVLAVDPSSAVSGGSVLGDKTRMQRLARDERAFVRPSPGGSSLGGIARRTREALLLCEAAGHDVVLVETIGVGQSEMAVAGMVDHFLLLALAGAGDELQGIKRGITEIADLVVITKCDGDNVAPARRAAAQIRAALALLPGPGDGGGAERPVLTCSSRDDVGLDDVWETIRSRHAEAEASGRLGERRRRQSLAWMDHALEELLRERFESDPAVAAALDDVSRDVLAGTLDPTTAARRLLALFLRDDRG